MRPNVSDPPAVAKYINNIAPTASSQRQLIRATSQCPMLANGLFTCWLAYEWHYVVGIKEGILSQNTLVKEVAKLPITRLGRVQSLEGPRHFLL